ncbi:TetR/AcrR family transcriptional regulator [bacterium]|nr:TetR/AcrR family transcriptional regulator [bacterium]
MKSAIRVFAHRGYKNTTVHDLQTEMGMSRSAFYQYFVNKYGVVDEMLTQLLQCLADEAGRIALTETRVDPRERVRVTLSRVLRILLSERDLMRVLVSAPIDGDARLRERADRFFHDFRIVVFRQLVAGRDLGAIRELHIEIASYAVLGAVKEAMNWFLEGESRDESPRVGQLASALMAILGDGLFVAPRALAPAAARGESAAGAAEKSVLASAEPDRVAANGSPPHVAAPEKKR